MPVLATEGVVRDRAAPVPGRLALLPVPLLFVLLVVLHFGGWRESHEMPRAAISMTLLFTCATSLSAAWLVGRSFLVRPEPGLLLVVCGILVWGGGAAAAIAGGLAAGVTGGFHINTATTIHNGCVWLSGLCLLAGALLSARSTRSPRPSALWLAGSWAAAIGLVQMVFEAAEHGWMPVFFHQGQGGTSARTLLLVAAITMFGLTVLLIRSPQGRAPTAFTRWYSQALLLIAVGLLAILLETSHATPLSWVGRIAQYLGGIYMVVASVALSRDSGATGTLVGSRLVSQRHRYALAVAIVLCAAAVRISFLHGLKMRLAFITFYPAVMLSALYGGQRAGWLATGLSGLIVGYLWMEPGGSFAVADPQDMLGLLVFLGSGTLVSWIAEAMHQARSRANDAEFRARLTEQRKQADEQLRQVEEQLHHAQRLESVGRLAAGIAHEFNNMMTVVTGFSDMLLMELPSDAPQRWKIEEIRNAGERAGRLTGQILAFSRKQLLQPQLFDLSDAVDKVASRLRLLLDRSVQLETQAGAKACMVRADPAQIEQVLLGLAVNARDAMPHGGVLALTTQLFRADPAFAAAHAGMAPGAYVLLTVADTGIGMDDSTRQRAFEPFFTTKDIGKGTGLGLSMAYGIVKQSGGFIYIDSKPGDGTTFSIYLPCAQSGETQAACGGASNSHP